MLARLAAFLSFALLLSVSGFAWAQSRRGGLDVLARAGLGFNLLGTAVLWLRTDKPVEGRVLVVLSQRHGVTTADLLVALPLLLCAQLLRRKPEVRICGT